MTAYIKKNNLGRKNSLIFLFVLTISENFIYLISEKCLYWNQNPFLQRYYIEQRNLQVSPVSPTPDWNYSDIQSCKSSNYHTLDLCIDVYLLLDFSVHSLQTTPINTCAHVCMCMCVCTCTHACICECMYLHTCIHMRVSVCACASMYVCPVYVCLYV